MDNPNTPTRFMTPQEAATFLGGMNHRTLTRWARESYIPAYPMGEGKRRLWRFLAAELHEWMLLRGQGGGISTSDPAYAGHKISLATGAPIKEKIR